MTGMGESALMYAHLGLSVIPLHGKRPYFDNWYEVASKDDATIERWWTQNPTDNIGIATGTKSQVFVVDVDPRNGGEESIELLFNRHGKFPRTWEAVTGSGGRHYYFRMPNFAVGNVVGYHPGLDIKGTGGQVVCPPSIHPDTHKPYEWDGLNEITEEPLSEAPDWLLDSLREKGPKQQHVAIPLRIPKGVQHHTLVSLAGRLRMMGMDETEIYCLLSKVNERRCEVPGPDKNIAAIAKSMSRYQPHERNLYSEANKLWRMTRHVETQAEAERAEMRPVDAMELMRKPIAAPKMIIGDLLHNGLTIVAGRPKSGKSWLSLQLALSVSSGGIFIGALPVDTPGRVGYFALEESESRTASRLHRLVAIPDISLQNIEFLYSIKPLMNGGLQQLEAYIAKTSPTLVIIDTLLALVRGQGGKRSDVLRNDYEEVSALQKLATKHGTAILVVHHTSKIGGDGIDAVAGTTGVTAAADCIWMLRRQPDKKALLEAKGREVEESSYLMELDLSGPIGWNTVATGDEAETSLERMEILELLIEQGAMKPARIAAELRKNGAAVRKLLQKMYAASSIVKNSDGSYVAGRR